MTLLSPGYWPTTYWTEDYWHDDYWPDYGFVAGIERIHIENQKPSYRLVAAQPKPTFRLETDQQRGSYRLIPENQ